MRSLTSASSPGLSGGSVRLHTLSRQQEDRARHEADVMVELVRHGMQERLRENERALRLRGERRAMQTSLAVNGGLIILNCVLAVRGVQIWHLLQRVGFEGWVRTLASHLPWTRRVSWVVNAATRPVRQALRPAGAALRLPFRQAAAIRAAAERASLEAAEREAAARLPWHIASRKVWDTLCFVDRKTGGIGSWARRMVAGTGGLR